MKIIEGLKKLKYLEEKKIDIAKKIKDHSAYLSYETPLYTNQTAKVKEWLQVYGDLLKEILRLRIAIQRTNLIVYVTIELNGKHVEKSIAEWIHRRRDLAKEEELAWRCLTDRGLKENIIKQSTGETMKVEIVRCYDPEIRDKNIELFSSEPSLIDAKLEITNAICDLIEETAPETLPSK